MKYSDKERDRYNNDINEIYKYMRKRNASDAEISAFKKEFNVKNI